MMPSSEKSPTQVTIMAPEPVFTLVPESIHGLTSKVLFTSCDSPVKADSSQETLLHRNYVDES